MDDRKIWIAGILAFNLLLWLLLFAFFSEVLFGLPNAAYLGVMTNAVFSYLLYRVYKSQNSILQTQSEIASAQTKIMEGDHVPILGVEEDDFGIANGKPDYEDGTVVFGEDGVWGWFLVSNLGNEIAENISVRTLLRYESTDQLDSVYRGVSEPLENLGLISQTSRGKGAVLPPTRDSKPMLMRTSLSLERVDEDGGAHKIPFNRGIRSLVEGAEVVTDVGFVLEYKNTHGQSFSMRLDPAYRLKPEAFSGFDSMKEPNNSYSIYELIDRVPWTPPEAEHSK